MPQLEPSADVGRVGLALSGGGLRASMYHTGVLLQLARHGVLRRVEVISTVSGGSIVGALLYLRLRELLASDEKITDAHYVNLVVEMHGELRALARKNLRTRAFANPWAILKMASPYYSRSERIGELYDQSLFTKHHPAGADAKGHVRLRDMAMDWTANAERDAKIPVLLLNTTALNTGHNFRFGPRTMGEPPAETPTALDVDKGPRLLHPENYGQLPRKLADFKLGRAVAASTCVPGLFFPVPVSGMYQGLKLQLVDGGVHDNQGIQGLLDDPEFACDTVVVSDGSGQMDCKPYPATDAVHVLSRANTVLMQRVRAEQMLNADLRARSIAVHLRSGLGVEYHYPTRADKTPGIIEHPSDTVEHGGIVFSAEVQRRLAHVRTDLDSFTDLEICTLGLLGYASTADCLSELNPTETVPENDDWWIFRATPAVTQPTRRQRRQLRAASSVWLRPIKMVSAGAWILAILLAGVVIYGVNPVNEAFTSAWRWLPEAATDAWDWKPQASLARIAAIVTAVGLLLLAGRAAERHRLTRILWWTTTISLNVLRTFPMMLLCLAANVYLRTVDRWVLWRGKLP